MFRRRLVGSGSGKGGPGKSLVACLMVYSAASNPDNRIAVADCDVGGSNLTQMLGVEGYEPSVVEVERDDGTKAVRLTAARLESHWNVSVFTIDMWSECLARMMEDEGYRMDSGQPVGHCLGDRGSWEAVRQMLTTVDWGFRPNIIICDLPAAAGAGFQALRGVGKLEVVVTSIPRRQSIKNCREFLRVCAESVPPVKVLGVVANMVGEHFGPEGPVKTMALDFGVPYLGSIPLSREIGDSLDNGIVPSEYVGVVDGIFV